MKVNGEKAALKEKKNSSAFPDEINVVFENKPIPIIPHYYIFSLQPVVYLS